MSTKQCPGLASIIVPCFNQREFTRGCLQSLFRYTRAPWELIVVDNGSTDDTRAYLAGVQDATSVPVTVVANATNLGFPAAINQGLQLAQGEYLVLLNNDVVVTDAWLDQLTVLTTAKIGLTAKDAREEKEGKARIDLNAETAETKTESENRNRTIIDFNEARAETAGSSTLGPVPSPPLAPPFAPMATLHATSTPLAPPSQGGESMFASERVALLAAKTPHGPDRVGSTIGLVGPMSNYAAPPQLVEEVPYHDLERNARSLPGGGARSTAASGSPCPSCRDSACS